MKESEKLDGLREEYISTMAELAGLAMDRASLLPSDSGVFNHMRTASDTSETQKEIEAVNRKIADTCNKMRSVEQRARGEIGIPALFGTDVPNVIRVAFSMLAGKRIKSVPVEVTTK